MSESEYTPFFRKRAFVVTAAALVIGGLVVWFGISWRISSISNEAQAKSAMFLQAMLKQDLAGCEQYIVSDSNRKWLAGQLSNDTGFKTDSVELTGKGDATRLEILMSTGKRSYIDFDVPDPPSTRRDVVYVNLRATSGGADAGKGFVRIFPSGQTESGWAVESFEAFGVGANFSRADFTEAVLRD